MNKPTLSEREVIIRWSMADKQASIYADNPTLCRKLDKLCAEHPEAYRCTMETDAFGAKRYEVPVRFIRFGKPASKAQLEAVSRIGFKLQKPTAHVHPGNLQPCG